MNKDIYDDHASAYPNDSRIEGFFFQIKYVEEMLHREKEQHMSYYWNNNTQSNGYANGLRPDGSCANWGVRVYPKIKTEIIAEMHILTFLNMPIKM